MPNLVKLGKETFEIPREIEVDNQTSTLIVKVVFDHGKGTFSISSKLTTNQVSNSNKAIQKSVLSAVKDLMQTGVNFALEKRQEWIDQQPTTAQKTDPNQLDLNDQISQIKNVAKKGDEGGEGEGGKPGGKRPRAKKVTAKA